MKAALERLAQAGLSPVPPSLPPPGASPADVEARALLAAQGIEEPGELIAALPEALPMAAGVAALLAAVASTDPVAARDAGFLLTGLGPGLTPLGDDLLTGAAAAVSVLGLTAGLRPGTPRRWVSQLAAAARTGRTSRASAELLELATRGLAIPPLHGLLDLSSAGARRWRAALSTLERVGSTSGRGCALAAAATCTLLPRAGKPACTVGIFPMTPASE
jgi:hypothetical protein